MTDTDIADKTKTETAEKAKLFNLPQLAGGAMAAVTAAAVGSQLGVAGTLGGAAVASLLAAVAGTLYTKGLEHTRDGVKKIVLRDARGDTEVLTVPDDGVRESSAQTVAVPVKGKPKAKGGPSRSGTRSAWSNPWAVVGGMVATAAVTFVVSMGLITGWEFTSGQTLDGKGGTTIGQAARPSASASAKPSASASASASASPTPTASDTPTATPTPTETATATPTPSATTTASETATGQAVSTEAATSGD